VHPGVPISLRRAGRASFRGGGWIHTSAYHLDLRVGYRMRKRGYSFVTLEEATEDPAYLRPGRVRW